MTLTAEQREQINNLIDKLEEGTIVIVKALEDVSEAVNKYMNSVSYKTFLEKLEKITEELAKKRRMNNGDWSKYRYIEVERVQEIREEERPSEPSEYLSENNGKSKK